MRSSCVGIHPPPDSRNKKRRRGNRSQTPPHQEPPERHDHVDGVADGLAQTGSTVQLVHRHVRDHHVLALGDEAELAARARRVDVHAGMERDRDVEVLARGPERVVGGVVERQLVDVRRRADEHALQPPLPHRALGFHHRERGRLERHARHREQPSRMRGAILGDPVVVRALAVEHELDVVERVDRVVRPEEQRRRRVEHGDVDAVAVHVGDAGVGIVAARDAQALEHVVELLRRHADGGGHRVLQVATSSPHRTARVVRLVHVVFDDLARDPVAPPLLVHPRRPEVVGLHRVAVGVDDHGLVGHRASLTFPSASHRRRRDSTVLVSEGLG